MTLASPLSTHDGQLQSKIGASLDTQSPKALVQYLGHPYGDDALDTIGGVVIDNSNDIHFGDKNFYHGPVTIRQIVYANGNAALKENNENSCPDEDESDQQQPPVIEAPACLSSKAHDDAKRTKNPSSNNFLRKGYIWLQNVSTHRPIEIVIFVVVVLLFFSVLTLVLVLRQSPNGKSSLSTSSNNGQPDFDRPVDYIPDITVDGQNKTKLRIVSRSEWLAQPPRSGIDDLVTPVPHVIIHHTATEFCQSIAQCVHHVRYIQNFHIESQNWSDIGYNFLVGGDGSAYEGRGWTKIGAHTHGWNSKSMGIAFIGTFTTVLPSEVQFMACKKLIQKGVEDGYIQSNYTLFGMRQIWASESPGKALYDVIKTWPHWSKV